MSHHGPTPTPPARGMSFGWTRPAASSDHRRENQRFARGRSEALTRGALAITLSGTVRKVCPERWPPATRSGQGQQHPRQGVQKPRVGARRARGTQLPGEASRALDGPSRRQTGPSGGAARAWASRAAGPRRRAATGPPLAPATPCRDRRAALTKRVRPPGRDVSRPGWRPIVPTRPRPRAPPSSASANATWRVRHLADRPARRGAGSPRRAARIRYGRGHLDAPSSLYGEER